MTKFNVGDTVRVLNKREIMGGSHLEDGKTYRVERMMHGYPIIRGRVIASFEYHAIELVRESDTNRRLTEAEAKIAALEAEVKALMGAKSMSLTTNITMNGAAKMFDSKKFAADLTKLLEGKPRPKLTPNQRRADVIKRAQAFVAEHTEYNGKASAGRGVRIGYMVCIPEFIVNKEKRAVTVLFKFVGNRSTVHAKAVAKCAPDDVFNADIGKAIALGRALGIKVPMEFVDAVKPTEYVAGQIITFPKEDGADWHMSKKYVIETVDKFDSKLTKLFDGGGEAFGGNMTRGIDYEDEDSCTLPVIDDTDAVYV